MQLFSYCFSVCFLAFDLYASFPVVFSAEPARFIDGFKLVKSSLLCLTALAASAKDDPALTAPTAILPTAAVPLPT